MGRVLVGTSSWTEPTLINAGTFYPPWADTPAERLAFYASQFPVVEVDSTYYALPPERNARLWVARTPPQFVFDVKPFRLFTKHPTPPKALPPDLRAILRPDDQDKENIYLKDLPPEAIEEIWSRFRSALRPLQQAGRLGVMVFQYPAWFTRQPDSFDHLLWCQEHLPGISVAIEFRSATWLREPHQEETLRFLREHHLAYVCVDEPQGFPSSVPPIGVATTDMAVVRFHGRNRETWAKKGISVAERFRYLYNPTELAEWVDRLRNVAATTREVHVLMNNCYRDYAVVNARQLSLLLEGAPPEQVQLVRPATELP